jgi:signal recognition particle subunit SRP54
MVLDKLGRALHAAVRKVTKAAYVDEKTVKEMVRDIQSALLQADVNVELTLKLCRAIEERALTEKPPPGVGRREHVIGIVYSELSNLMGKSGRLQIQAGRPNLLLLVGLQGSGKTTSAAKLAHYFRKKGFRVGMVCADTYRPGAYLQLYQLGEQIGVKVLGDPHARDPVKLCRDGVERLKSEGCELILVDTAGRHKREEELMQEMKTIAEAIKPDGIMLVIDATIGQQAKEQAEAFHSTTPLGYIFLSKLDGSAKGGGAISAVAATGASIEFVGTGEHVDEIEPFDPQKFVGRLLGRGDLDTLLKKMEQVPEGERRSLETKVALGKMNLGDLQEMLEAVQKMGPLDKLLPMVPGLGVSIPKEQLKIGQDKLKKFRVIINSMTPEEREDPAILNASRIRRIARGSGTTEAEVKELLKQYEVMKQLAKAMSRGGMKGPLRKLFRQLE